MKTIDDYINTLKAHINLYECGDIPTKDFCRIAKEYIDKIDELGYLLEHDIERE